MKPVFQKTVDGEVGDCFSAALASLLEVPLEEVPRFAELHGVTTMMKPAREWLAEHHGLSIVTIQMAEEIETGKDIRIIGAVPGTPCIAGGRSPNFEGRQHAVVGEIDEHGMNFRMTHDPNPSGRGIVGLPIHLYFLVPLSYTITGRATDWLRAEVELEAERDRYKLLAFEAVGLLSHGRPIHPGEPAIALQVSKRTVDKFVTTLRELVAPGVEKENKKE